MLLFYSILVAVFSLTIFLNYFEEVRMNRLFFRLSWFLLPLGFICLTLGKAINELITAGSPWEMLFAIVAGIPFIIGLTIGFRRFKRTIY
jgi:hypothetical protein